jgi:hypothetical protein
MLACLASVAYGRVALQPEDTAPAQTSSAFLRAERHTGSNFLEEILSLNFQRTAELAPRSMMANSTCKHQRLSISADCYVPTTFFSGCNTHSDRAQARRLTCRTSSALHRPQPLHGFVPLEHRRARTFAAGSTVSHAVPTRMPLPRP